MPSLKPISSFYLLMCSSSSGRKTGLPDKFLFAIHSLRISQRVQNRRCIIDLMVTQLDPLDYLSPESKGYC